MGFLPIPGPFADTNRVLDAFQLWNEPAARAWAEPYGSDWERAWRECEEPSYLEAIALLLAWHAVERGHSIAPNGQHWALVVFPAVGWRLREDGVPHRVEAATVSHIRERVPFEALLHAAGRPRGETPPGPP